MLEESGFKISNLRSLIMWESAENERYEMYFFHCEGDDQLETEVPFAHLISLLPLEREVRNYRPQTFMYRWQSFYKALPNSHTQFVCEQDGVGCLPGSNDSFSTAAAVSIPKLKAGFSWKSLVF